MIELNDELTKAVNSGDRKAFEIMFLILNRNLAGDMIKHLQENPDTEIGCHETTDEERKDYYESWLEYGEKCDNKLLELMEES